jgi:hypothetical protein
MPAKEDSKIRALADDCVCEVARRNQTLPKYVSNAVSTMSRAVVQKRKERRNDRQARWVSENKRK